VVERRGGGADDAGAGGGGWGRRDWAAVRRLLRNICARLSSTPSLLRLGSSEEGKGKPPRGEETGKGAGGGNVTGAGASQEGRARDEGVRDRSMQSQAALDALTALAVLQVHAAAGS